MRPSRLNYVIILSLLCIAIGIIVGLANKRFDGDIQTTMGNCVNSIVAGLLGFLAREMLSSKDNQDNGKSGSENASNSGNNNASSN